MGGRRKTAALFSMNISRKHLTITAVATGALVLCLKSKFHGTVPGETRQSFGIVQVSNRKSPLTGNQSLNPHPGEKDWQDEFFSGLTRTLNATNAQDQLNAAHKVIERMPRSDLLAALSSVGDKAAPSQKSQIETLLIERLAALVPSDAAAWVDQNMSGLDRSNNLMRVSAIWAASDVAAAWDWARQLPKPEDRAAALTEAAYEIARQKPSIALTFADEFPDGVSAEAVAQAASIMAEKSPQQALEAAGALITESLQQRATGSVAITWAEVDPVSAGKLAVQSLPPGRIQNDAVIGVLQRWAQSDPTAAAAWVSNFPEGELGDTAMDNLVKLWTDKDAGAVGEWLGNLPEGPRRDVACAAYVEKLAPQEPQVAALWIARISDETIREQSLRNLAEVWRVADPAAAQNWIAHNEAATQKNRTELTDTASEPPRR
jgi:hypothetical protein